MKQERYLGFQFKQINDKFKESINSKLNKYDITFSQFSVLHYLFSKNGTQVTQKDIEEFLELKHPTVIGILKRLEHKGFVHCIINSEDKRYRNVLLTEKALTLKKDLDQNKEMLDDILKKGLSDDEIQQLKSLLDRIIENLSNYNYDDIE